MNKILSDILERIEDATNGTESETFDVIDDYDEGFVAGVMASFDGGMIDEKVLNIDSIPIKHHTKPGTAGENSATIAKRIISANKTLKKSMAAIQFFINRRGVDLSPENFKRATDAQAIIAKTFAKKSKKAKKK